MHGSQSAHPFHQDWVIPVCRQVHGSHFARGIKSSRATPCVIPRGHKRRFQLKPSFEVEIGLDDNAITGVIRPTRMAEMIRIGRSHHSMRSKRFTMIAVQVSAPATIAGTSHQPLPRIR